MQASSSVDTAATTDTDTMDLADMFDYSSFGDEVPHSASLSRSPSDCAMPPAKNQGLFNIPIKAEPSLLPSQPLTGPSHEYDLYQQATGIVPGALASTYQNSLQVHVNDFSSTPFVGLAGIGGDDSDFNFNNMPSQSSSLDHEMGFYSPTYDTALLPNGDSSMSPAMTPTIDPSSIRRLEPTPSPPMPSQSGSFQRMYPGSHQQAAQAKARAQQRQQQQMIQMQQQKLSAQPKPPQRPAAQSSADPIVQQTISQVLNNMRVSSSPSDSQTPGATQGSRSKKDEEDMDEDERLLASEEGKKLSSRERRQLRNKVSARAFRSRRKEYIGQLEGQLKLKTEEAERLQRAHQAMCEENKRLQNFTRTLLSTPHFQDYLQGLVSNPQARSQQSRPQATPQIQSQRQFAVGQQRIQQQQLSMNMMGEQGLGLSMLDMDTTGNLDSASSTDEAMFNSFNPDLFINVAHHIPRPVLEMDTDSLSGKTSNFVGQLALEELDSEKDAVVLNTPPAALEKNMPVLAHEPPKSEETETPTAVVDSDFENDPYFALYHGAVASPVRKEPMELDLDALSYQAAVAAPVREKSVDVDAETLSHADLFGGVEPEKALARYTLVDAAEEDCDAVLSMVELQQVTDMLEKSLVVSRLELLTIEL